MSAPTRTEAKQGDVLEHTLPRFFAHWVAATLGFWFWGLLPVLQSWTDPAAIVAYSRLWAVLLVAVIIAFFAGMFNSNIPNKPFELLKSVLLGCVLNPASVLARSHVIS